MIMKFSNKLTDTTLRYLILIISFYALIISSICFVNVMFLKNMSTDDCLWVNEFNGKTIQEGFFIVNIIPGGVADRAGLKEGDILVEINKVKLVLLNQYHGENIEYKILRDVREFVTKIFIYKYFNSNYLIYSILGFTFLIIGLMVGYSKPKENISLLFYLLGTSASSGLLVYSGGMEIIQNTNIFLFISVIVFIVLFHPLFIHFFFTYPIKYNFKNRKKLLIILYIYAIILPIVQFAVKSTGNLSLMNVTSMVVNISLGAYLIGGIVTFLISYIKIKDKIVKRPLKIIMYGFILGFVGFSYFFTFMLINKKPLFLINDTLLLPTILILAIPISFGYSIFKYKILDTEFIVKRGLIFGILTVTIGGIYY